MKNAPPTLSVYVTDSTVYLKIFGRAVFTSSVQFKTLVQEMRARGYEQFIIDLDECVVMDSTFLGVLAGTASRLSRSRGEQTKSGIELVNPNQRVAELLDNLGVMHLFDVSRAENRALRDAQHVPAEARTPSREEISRTCLEAHRTLMELNPDNVPKLKDVTSFLAQDLKKLEARHSSTSSGIP